MFGPGPNRGAGEGGGFKKIKKVPSFSWEKFKIREDPKNKMLSIFVLNMVKYTNISLILTDFLPIFFIFNLFKQKKIGFPRFPVPKASLT